MKKLIGLISLVSVTSAFALPFPKDLVGQLESEIVPSILQGSYQLTRLARQNSSGRMIPKGTCVFSNGTNVIKVEYCDMAAPQAARIDMEFNDLQEKHYVYVERNSSSLLPRFSIMSQDQTETCVVSYAEPVCGDNVWKDEVRDLRILNRTSDASPEVVRYQMNFATQIERISKILRDYSKTLP